MLILNFFINIFCTLISFWWSANVNYKFWIVSNFILIQIRKLWQWYMIFQCVFFFLLNFAFICVNVSMFLPYILTLSIPGIVSMCAECSGKHSCKSHDIHYSLSYVIISILSSNKRNLLQYKFSVYDVFLRSRALVTLWYFNDLFHMYWMFGFHN